MVQISGEWLLGGLWCDNSTLRERGGGVGVLLNLICEKVAHSSLGKRRWNENSMGELVFPLCEWKNKENPIKVFDTYIEFTPPTFPFAELQCWVCFKSFHLSQKFRTHSSPHIYSPLFLGCGGCCVREIVKTKTEYSQRSHPYLPDYRQRLSILQHDCYDTHYSILLCVQNDRRDKVQLDWHTEYTKDII